MAKIQKWSHGRWVFIDCARTLERAQERARLIARRQPFNRFRVVTF